ncbi:hypothetical protein PG995_008799 [Apiospora arundinis]
MLNTKPRDWSASCSHSFRAPGARRSQSLRAPAAWGSGGECLAGLHRRMFTATGVPSRARDLSVLLRGNWPWWKDGKARRVRLPRRREVKGRAIAAILAEGVFSDVRGCESASPLLSQRRPPF